MNSIDTSSWKEFLITDLFELCPVKSKLTKLNLYDDGTVPVYSSETSNNGINGYTDVAAQFIVDEKTPLYLVFGDHTCSMNIADKSFCVMDNVKVLRPKYCVSAEMLLYISTVWKKAIPDLGYARHWSVAKDLSIKLPVKEVEEIDWEYMQERITELEQERITELEQYLIATGLNDYELTDEDKEILATKLNDGVSGNTISSSGCLKEARKFKMESIFNISSPKNKFNANRITFENTGHPYIARCSTNNGIRGYIEEDVKYLNKEKTFSFGQDTATIYWQELPYFTGDKIKILTPLFPCNEKIAQYMIERITDSFSGFSWGSCSFSENVIKGNEILLPIQMDHAGNPIIDISKKYHPKGFIPDSEYMEKYIRAIEKEVIKDVVDWKDKVIEKTKKVVED